MITAIKKLIENIDQLVFWLNDNPKTPMPSQEKKRAIAILNKIINAEELSAEEWEKLKPQLLLLKQTHNIRNERTTKNVITSAIKTVTKRPINVVKQYLPQKEKKQADKSFTATNGKKMKICPYCKASVSPKKFLIHTLNKCNVVKRENINLTRNNKSAVAYIQENIDTGATEEKGLDGSYGYHQIRENGRFGSHPMFDNMGDDAHP